MRAAPVAGTTAAAAVAAAAVPAWSASSRFCYTLFIGLSTLLVQVCVLGLAWARRRLRRWRRRYVPLEAWDDVEVPVDHFTQCVGQRGVCTLCSGINARQYTQEASCSRYIPPTEEAGVARASHGRWPWQ